MIFHTREIQRDIGKAIYLARVSCRLRGKVPIIRIVTDGEHLIPWDLVCSTYLSWNRPDDIIEQFWGMGCIVKYMISGAEAAEDGELNNISETRMLSLVHNQTVKQPRTHEIRFLNNNKFMGKLNFQYRGFKGADKEFMRFLELPSHIIQIVGHGTPSEKSPARMSLILGTALLHRCGSAKSG